MLLRNTRTHVMYSASSPYSTQTYSPAHYAPMRTINCQKPTEVPFQLWTTQQPIFLWLLSCFSEGIPNHPLLLETL